MGNKSIPREFREVFNYVNERFSSCSSACADAQSELTFKNIVKHTVVNAEVECIKSRQQQMCDRLVVFVTSRKTICFAAVELKGTEPPEKLEQQLQQCAQCLECRLSDCADYLISNNYIPQVVFIIVHRSRNSSSSAITDIRIAFCGRLYRAVPIRSGESIRESECGFRSWPRNEENN